MCNALILIAVAQCKLSSEVTTQVDLTADGEYLYTVALASLYTHCDDSHS